MSARVALADVLAALTDYGADAAWWREMAQEHPLSVEADGVQVSRDADRWEELAPWAHDSTAEALEALHTRALWPFAAEGDGAARWRCEACGGRGATPLWPTDDVSDPTETVRRCRACGCEGSVRSPPTIPALIAVASLGASALLRAASLAEDIARAAGHPKARIVWRVMTRAAIEEHHRNVLANAHPAGSIAFAQVLAATVALFPRDTAAAFAWGDDAGISRALTNPVADLARTEDGTATGVHLVGLDAGDVTLAVESVS